MLLLKSIGLCFFGCDICFNLVLIGMVVSQGSVDLSQRQVADPAGDLLRTEPQLVPTDNAPHRDARASDTRSATAHVRRVCDKGTNVHKGNSRHFLSSYRDLALTSVPNLAPCTFYHRSLIAAKARRLTNAWLADESVRV